jgi:hypothetical protein
MKSYFAKLAARATLANASTPGSARVTPDPFEATVTLPESIPPSAVVRGTPLVDQAPGLRRDSSKPSSKTVEMLPNTKSTVIEPPTMTPKITVPSAEPSRSTSEATNVSELRPAAELSEGRNERTPQRHEVNLRSPTKQAQGLTESAESLRLVPITNTEEQPPSPRDETKLNQRLADVENEQGILLRKADAFMAGMFERQRRSTIEDSRGEEQKDEEQESLAKLERPSQLPTRLQPPATQARVSEPADDEASLVIGRLTVEVVQPPTPAVTPQRQVVVIDGGRQIRAGIPSAHRFGFSRF